MTQQPTQPPGDAAFIEESGPYRVDSIALAYGEIRIRPRWPQFGDDWQDERRAGNGGGPGVFSRMGLASAIERLLNAGHRDYAVTAWRNDERSTWTYEDNDANED